jgi:N-terminal half of MaoC dehydratase
LLEQPQEIIGLELPVLSTSAERSRLREFARVVGISDPQFTDLEAARASGYSDLPIPPTYYFSLDLGRPDPGLVIRELGIDQRQVLHGEQRFAYHQLAFAGQELTFAVWVTDYYERKGGALRFVVRQTQVTRLGDPIVTLTNTLVARRLEMLP